MEPLVQKWTRRGGCGPPGTTQSLRDGANKQTNNRCSSKPRPGYHGNQVYPAPASGTSNRFKIKTGSNPRETRNLRDQLFPGWATSPRTPPCVARRGKCARSVTSSWFIQENPSEQLSPRTPSADASQSLLHSPGRAPRRAGRQRRSKRHVSR